MLSERSIVRSIPLSVPEIRGNEWDYVRECLDTGWVSSAGEYVDRFEGEISQRLGAGHAVATSSGTASLHIALMIAGVEAEDEVLVSSLTFIAPANAIRYLGAWPVFVDAEPNFWQMDPQRTVDFLNRDCVWRDGALFDKLTDRRVRAILPVHILGHPVDMDPIIEVARKYELAVIEDATESLGAHYKDRSVGQIGDMACFSFNGNKIITAGGGGMFVTDREEWADRARYLTTQAKDDAVEYVHREIGYNYRLCNIQAAMGCAQLEQLDEFVAAKRRVASSYGDALHAVHGIDPMRQAEWAYSVWWLYTVLVDEAEYGMDSRALLRNLRENEIESRPLWQPLHLSPAHADARPVECPVAEQLYRRALSLPCSVGLRDGELKEVVKTIRSFANDARLI
jgi:perosamine synthetase